MHKKCGNYMEPHKFTKIKITNAEDFNVLSLILQDSIYSLSMGSFHADKKNCLRMIFNRFCWENSSLYTRVHTAIYIHDVKNIYVNDSINDDNKHQMLNLLTSYVTGENEIIFVFSENKKIKIEVSELLVYVKDLHEPWPINVMPLH